MPRRQHGDGYMYCNHCDKSVSRSTYKRHQRKREHQNLRILECPDSEESSFSSGEEGEQHIISVKVTWLFSFVFLLIFVCRFRDNIQMTFLFSRVCLLKTDNTSVTTANKAALQEVLEQDYDTGTNEVS